MQDLIENARRELLQWWLSERIVSGGKSFRTTRGRDWIVVPETPEGLGRHDGFSRPQREQLALESAWVNEFLDFLVPLGLLRCRSCISFSRSTVPFNVTV